MTKKTAPLLTDQPWFSREALNLIDHTLHGRRDEAYALEQFLVAQMSLHFLDHERADPNYAHAGVLSFFGFCERNIGRSYAQILQDLWVLYMLAEKRKGFFVEFGACDGKKLSNTLLLEQSYDWTGILAEPNKSWHKDLAANRSAQISKLCVAAQSNKRVSFWATDDKPELSRIASIIPDDVHEHNGNRDNGTKYMVRTISLLDLLRRHKAPELIDYLSIDTEGSEYEILQAFDFSQYSFRLITVEHAGETKKREQIRELLLSHGYSQWLPLLTRWDDWYVGPRIAD